MGRRSSSPLRTWSGVCVVVLALSSCGDSSSTQPTTTTTTRSAATTATTATTTTTVATTTVATSTTTTTTRAPGAVPSAVTVVRAGPAGGSGEITVVWSGVALATGYRVSRALTADGPFTTTADYDVATGTSVKASGVTNVYFTTSQGFNYVEVVTDSAANGPRRYYRVTAYNAAGAAAPSAVVCGTPPGFPTC